MPIPAQTSHPFSPARLLRLSRRVTGCLALVAALLASTLTGAPAARAAGIYDNMEYLANRLPPGILHCRDRAIRILYAQEVHGLWNDFDRIYYRTMGEYSGYYDSVIVQSSSGNIEPSLYVLGEEINYRRDGTFAFIPEVDIPQMRSFADGIKAYYGVYRYRWPTPQGKWRAWHRKGYKGHSAGHKYMEDKFIHSIAYAAFVTYLPEKRCLKKVGNTCLEYEDPVKKAEAEDAAQQYMESDWAGKRDVLARMERAFQKMGNGNVNSTDPYDPYNRKLTAAWVAYYLSGLYWDLFERNPDSVASQDDKHLGQLVTDYIAVPLIDPVGYNIMPFKGQHELGGGGRRENVGYTERTYFERQRSN